ncbi:2-succinyl-6-hydroxy-2,4-cyclohexadiene-1-carboxylate synthase [Terasakiispira papahanaumokuakeensis]|uniref:Putative 2-succinyl-6-hydroxy-2,4-cyclohexadiene-1-carboxylate synthase n=1 Tax=Terasakiispira papahanaumokuakeensis TaxID=197479 RepID=A0A1E2VA03_9GAMM|nr:2-succinyl-6-hydroxy-2,4-cyclohexadiene-1-carboxylate synthase [Terasakiispira papahanaumokuakeensis]ODC03485.1 2-succinyl-6-hydroxy-2,4-cyclohexadiene-1-carboxylate synthase [Terasakiispira papahanaumokuakeensis]
MPMPPVVMLHGFLGDRADFPLNSALSSAAYPLDLPGHGQQTQYRLSKHQGFADFGHYFEACITALGLQDYWLYGYSLGGRLALSIAARQPEGLRGVILESVHPGLTDAESRVARCQHDHAWAEAFREEPMTQVLARWYQQAVFANLSEPQRQQLIQRRQHNQGAAVADMLEATSLGRQPDYRSWLSTPHCPVHYLAPGQDLKFKQLGQAVQSCHPDIQLHHFHDAGHNLHQACPRQWQQILQEILHA